MKEGAQSPPKRIQKKDLPSEEDYVNAPEELMDVTVHPDTTSCTSISILHPKKQAEGLTSYFLDHRPEPGHLSLSLREEVES